jgi:hypothetical protein
MVTLKDLVIRITNQFQFFINKTFMYSFAYGNELYLGVQVGENAVESFQLFYLLSKDVNADNPQPRVLSGL